MTMGNKYSLFKKDHYVDSVLQFNPIFTYGVSTDISLEPDTTLETQYQQQYYELREEQILPLSSTKDSCVICQDKEVNTYLNCGHSCICYRCAYEWIQTKIKATCPLCREPITKVSIHYKLDFHIEDSRSLQ